MKVDRWQLIIFCSSLILVGLTAWFLAVHKSIGYIITLILTIIASIVVFICMIWYARIKEEQQDTIIIKKQWKDLSKKERICLTVIWVAVIISMITVGTALVFHAFI